MKIKKEKTVPENRELINSITPMSMTFKAASIQLGEYKAKLYGAVKYPQKAPYGWLAKLTNLPGSVATIGFNPMDSSAFIESLSKSIILNRGNAESAKDPLTQNRANQAASDAERIMKEMDSGGETVGVMSLTIMPMANKEEEFEKVSRRVLGNFAVSKMKLRTMSSLQKESYKAMSPTHTIDKTTEDILGRMMPLSSFVGGFPFASSGFNDGCGYCLGRDTSGGLIITDPWLRGSDRTNSNMTIMGVAGTGKSTAIKSIAISEYMRGTKIIFIDVEREYKDLCEALGGDRINCGAGAGGMLNPLQIRPTPKDENEESMGDMALYLKTLETFFSLYIPSLTGKQKALLKESLIGLYNLYNIYWNTDIATLKNEDFPTFSDLYTYIELNEEKDKDCKDLLLLLKDIAEGSDSFIWNGHTNINTNARCVCLDTFELQNTSDNVKRAQYFNLLSYCWQLMSENRDEKVLLICDEAYIMIDPNVPQSLVFLRNMEKRARKYEAAVAIISHSVVDFLSPEVKLYGQALLDIPCIKILFGTDGQNLKETKELYNLTEAEEELLSAKRRGKALLMVGSKRMNIDFDIPKYKMDIIGKGGGR